MAKQWYEATHPVFNGTTPPTNKRFRAGSVRKSVDGSDWLYAPGVAGLVKGDWVAFQANTYAPVRMTGTTTGQVGIAAAANTSTTTYSWYMVSGSSKNNNLSGLVNLETDGAGSTKAVYQTATTGRGSTTTTGAAKIIMGAIADGAPASNLGDVILNRPFAEGTATV